MEVDDQPQRQSNLLLEPLERPEYGTRGRPVGLKANIIRLKVEPKSSWFKYEVEVWTAYGKDDRRTDKIVITKLREIWFAVEKSEREKRSNYFKGVRIIFDGRKVCVAASTLPQNNYEIAVDVPDRGQFMVKISNPLEIRVDELNKWVSPNGPTSFQGEAMDALAALNVLFIHCLSGEGFPSTKNVFYVEKPESIPRLDHRLHKPLDLVGGIQLWRGFFQSVRTTPALGYPGIFTNVDTTSGAFYKGGNLIDVVKNFLGRRPGQDLVASSLDHRERVCLNRFSKGFRVDAQFDQRTKHRGRPIKAGFSEKSARGTTFFDDSQGRTVSVEEFFRIHYNCILRHPHAPCVRVNDRVCWPAELCSLPDGVKYPKKLTSKQQAMASDAKFQAMAPRDRMRAILAVGTESLRIAADTMSEFGVYSPLPGAEGLQLTNVQGRILSPPKIHYQTSNTQPMKGAWQMRPRGGDLLLKPASFKSFGIIVSSPNDAQGVLRSLPELLMGMNGFGLRCPDRFGTELIVFAEKDISRTMERAVGAAERFFNQKPQVIFWVFDKDSDPSYNHFKTQGARIGIATQALLSKNLGKLRGVQFTVNMALKINAKLGGQNHSAGFGTLGGAPNTPGWFESHPAMLFGADLTHTQDKPSIAAVVASCDRRGLCYEEVVSVQPLVEPQEERGRAKKQEIIVYLKEMVLELFRRFVQLNAIAPPNSLVFYRDGVSDGEHANVLKYELSAIKNAIREFKLQPEDREVARLNEWDPKITFVLVVKRHHIRFFDGDSNIAPGTVVDSGVVDARAFDWYAAAHAGILGTTKATRYVVLQDENAMSADDVQTLTNALCHAYQRCNRAVSLPAPTYYAHLVCEKARGWFHHDDDTSTATSHSTPDAASRRKDYDQHVDILNGMQQGRRAFDKCAGSKMPVMWFL
ncbi:argonaute family member [Pseudohyphozyma bogoriensis]|nr:argonaute family member [Pseudohyphozyma bogoriensis]